MNDTNWQSRVTLLVNSCDAYADLWQPFFTLLTRYFVPLPDEILLNTETKEFHLDGYKALFKDENILGAYWNTIVIAVGTMIVSLVLINNGSGNIASFLRG